MRGQLSKALTRTVRGIVGCIVCRAWRCGAIGPDRQLKRTAKRARRRLDREVTREAAG